MRTLICFDVSDDKRRTKLVKVLKEYALRVQKSVFEAAELEQAAYLRMRSRAEGIVDPKTDCIRYYRICAACVGRVEHHGVGQGLIAPPEPFDIIAPETKQSA